MRPEFLVTLQLAAGVLGHGHIKSLSLNSKTYTAFLPVPTPDFTADAPSIVRKIGGDGPVLDILSSNITCNIGAEPIADDNGVSRTGEVAAGGTLKMWWTSWPHSGPIVTYMAKCEPDCGSFTGSEGNHWFKIAEAGYNATAQEWATYFMYNADNTWNITIPACLAPGEYLVRHEIIALSDCKNLGKCQFYPECIQIKVTGNGTHVFAEDELVGFPGAYQQRDPGILWNTNTQDPADYTIPGPAVFTCPS